MMVPLFAIVSMASSSEHGMKQPEAKKKTITVLLLCGLPGAGKSSLSAQWAATSSTITGEDDDTTPTTMAVIEYDHLQDAALLEVSMMIDDDDDNTDRALFAWRQSRQKALESLQGYLISRSDDDVSVILLDDNFFLRSMRKQVHQVCQRCIAAATAADESSMLEIYFGVVWVDTPLDVCLERNRDRGASRQVPEDVITRMHQRMEPPDPKKATWEQAVLRLDTNGSNNNNHNDNQENTHSIPKQLARFVHDIATLTEPVCPPVDPARERQRIESERHRTRASVLHRVDQYLRCCVTSVAKVRPRSARHANQVRKQVFRTQKLTSDDPGRSDGNDDMSWVKTAFLEGIILTTVEEGGLSWSEAELDTFHMELATILQAKLL
jgi:tRNA uridine 5-carbamoylmethylation protein Kti12